MLAGDTRSMAAISFEVFPALISPATRISRGVNPRAGELNSWEKPEVMSVRVDSMRSKRARCSLFRRLDLILATSLDGAAMTALNQGEHGLARFREGKALYQVMKSPTVFWPNILLMEAGACALAGKIAEGLSILDEVASIKSERTGGVLIADGYSLKGDLLLAQSQTNIKDAEACYQHAINIARPFEARMPELRAATRLSRLWRDQGKTARAAQLLSRVYQTFNEGFAAADLMEAKALLEELS